MALFIIGYDLTKKDEHDYRNLIDAIQGLGDWWHCLDSTWLVETNHTATEIRDLLWVHMHADDRLLVGSFSRPAAWRGFDDECTNWLKSHV